jgi:hypothetical protein
MSLGNKIAKSQSQNHYKYKPLKHKDSTRLLKVERDTKPNSSISAAEGSVRYKILEFAINSLPDYETASYAWGDTTKTVPIPVEQNNTLLVTESLAVGLPRLAQYCTTGYLWIDQLCTMWHSEIRRDE